MNRWKPVHWLEMITFFFFLGTQIYGFPERTGLREAKSHLRFYSENVIGLLSKKKKYPLALTTFARSIAFGKNLYKMPVTSHAAVSVSAYLFLHLNFTAIRKYLYLGQKPCQRKLDKSGDKLIAGQQSFMAYGTGSRCCLGLSRDLAGNNTKKYK